MPAVEVEDVIRVLARDVDITIGTGASLPEEEIEAAINSAAAEVEAKVAARYTVPTDPALLPKLLFDITVDIAAYLSTLVYRQGKRLIDAHPISLRYKRAQDLLVGIGSGKIDVPAVLDPDGPGGDGGTGSGTGLDDGAVGAPINPYPTRLFDVDLTGSLRSRSVWD